MTGIFFKVIVILICLTVLIMPFTNQQNAFTFSRLLDITQEVAPIISREAMQEIISLQLIPSIEGDWGAFEFLRTFLNNMTSFFNKTVSFLGLFGATFVNMFSYVTHYFQEIFGINPN